MRILQIGNGNERYRGARFYDINRKLYNGLTRNGHNVLFFSDHDTARHSNIWGSSKNPGGMRKANARLLEVVEHFRPEFFLFGHADIITKETVRRARAIVPDAAAAQFNLDPMFMESTFFNIARKSDVLDATFVTTAGPVLKKVSRPGHRVAFMPNPIDRSIETHQAHTRSDQPYDVFYAVRATTTTGDYRGNYRLDWPRQVKADVPELRPHFHGFDGAPEIFGIQFHQALGNCRMALNLSHRQTTKGIIRAATDEEMYLYSSDRISQTLGNGLLTFTHAANRLHAIYGDDALVYVDSYEQLYEKLRFFVAHDDERQRIAANGWRIAHAQFNEQLVAQYVVEATLGTGFSRDYAWPTEWF